MKLWLGWLVVLAAATGTGCDARSSPTTDNSSNEAHFGSVASATQALVPNGLIVHVVDGDTVDVDFDGRTERVRLIGVDTPETKKPNTPIECFGPEASEFTAGLLPRGTPVQVVRDVEARDDYGRLLAYVYRSADGLFVNFELVVHGFATPLTIRPNDTFSIEFVDAARAAEAADVGLWASCAG